MGAEQFYLRRNVQLTPLVNHWEAGTFLIPPATAAMIIANLQKMMDSFISEPDLHAEVLKDPAMRGAKLLDLDPSRVDEVKALLEQTKRDQTQMIRFADELKLFNRIIVNEAKGASLEGLYTKIPASLKGYVELTYDLNSFPVMRFIEALLYKSIYYDTSMQSIGLCQIYDDRRPFSRAPVFDRDGTLILNIPFQDAAISELARMKYIPQTFDYIKDRVRLDDDKNARFSTYLTTEPPRKADRYFGDGIRIRYFNHACLLIETKGVSILTDPVLSYEYKSDMFRYTESDLPETIDYILISHGHGDHFVIEWLLQLRHRVETVIVPKNGAGTLEDPSLKQLLQNLGFKRVVEIDDMELVPIENGFFMGIPFLGEHGDLSIRAKTAYLIRLEDKSILCAADSRNVSPELYEKVHEYIGDVDVLFLGMECDGAPLSWTYGPLITRTMAREADQSRRLSGSDCKRGMDIVTSLNCKQAYVYAMGAEPWLEYLTSLQYSDESIPIIESNKLVDQCRKMGIVSERLFASKEMII
jgi:L-ascorbate metabolism protein UlaG (beta-lactamase superfamily)